MATFINLLIDQDFEGKKKPKLSRTIDITEEIDMTVLHMAAKRNLTPIIRIILKYYPDMVYDECLCGGQKAQKALELALLESHDDASAHLIQTMTPQRYNFNVVHYYTTLIIMNNFVFIAFYLFKINFLNSFDLNFSYFSVCELFNYDQLSGDNNISFNSLVVNPAMKVNGFSLKFNKVIRNVWKCFFLLLSTAMSTSHSKFFKSLLLYIETREIYRISFLELSHCVSL